MTLERTRGAGPILNRSLSGAAALALLLIASPPASAERLTSLNIGNWKGGAYASNESGRFTHCAVSARYKSGITLLFSVTRDRKWAMGFASADWNLTKGDRYPVRYQVDKRPILSGTAVASSRKLATVSLPARDELFVDFRKGKILYVEANDTLLTFALTDADRMLKSLLDCAVDYASAETPDPFSTKPKAAPKATPNPFAARPPQADRAPPAGPTDQTRSEATTAVSIMMGEARVPFEFMSESDSPTLYAKHDALWKMGSIIGSLRVAHDMDAEAIEAAVLSSDSRACKDSFASGSLAEGSGSAIRLFTACEKADGKSWNTYYGILPRREGGNYLISIFGASDEVNDLGARLTDIASGLNGKGSVPGAKKIEL